MESDGKLRRADDAGAVARARTLRAQMTGGERILWSRLRHRQIGYRFRRQYPLGPYVLDFYCPDARLCIELDGEFHAGRLPEDRKRDAWLAENGILTLRFASWDAFEHLDDMARRISEICFERRGSPERR